MLLKTLFVDGAGSCVMQTASEVAPNSRCVGVCVCVFISTGQEIGGFCPGVGKQSLPFPPLRPAHSLFVHLICSVNLQRGERGLPADNAIPKPDKIPHLK